MVGLLKKAIVRLANRIKENSKRTSGNSSSPFDAQIKNLSAASQTLLTGVRLVCNVGYSMGHQARKTTPTQPIDNPIPQWSLDISLAQLLACSRRSDRGGGAEM